MSRGAEEIGTFAPAKDEAGEIVSDAPIRVLHIITRMIVGGAQEHVLLSVEGLDRMKEYDAFLMSGIDKGREGELLSRARETTKLIIVPELGRSVNPFKDLVAFWKLYRSIRRGKFHIVHTHSSKAGVLGRMAARLAGTPVVVHTLHSLVFHDYQPWAVNRLWRLIKKICVPLTHHYTSVSRIISEKAVAAGVAKPENYSIIYSGMELDWFLNAKFDNEKIRNEFGIALDAPVVGKIARLFPLKGHNELMDAAPEIVRRVPNVRFFLIGDGILLEHLQERARGYGILENFVFAGLVDRERIPEMISVMDVVVHTSLREGLPRVLPQALAMGKPCVSFDIDGAPEVVIHDLTGYLVAPYDSAGLANHVAELLGDPELRKKMGDEGRKLVDPTFRTETMVNETARLYQTLIERYHERIKAFNKKYPQKS